MMLTTLQQQNLSSGKESFQKLHKTYIATSFSTGFRHKHLLDLCVPLRHSQETHESISAHYHSSSHGHSTSHFLQKRRSSVSIPRSSSSNAESTHARHYLSERRAWP